MEKETINSDVLKEPEIKPRPTDSKKVIKGFMNSFQEFTLSILKFLYLEIRIFVEVYLDLDFNSVSSACQKSVSFSN